MKKRTVNKEIREKAKAAGVHLYEVAEAWGCQESYFSKLLRHEFSADDMKRCLILIEQLQHAHEQEATQ